MSALEVLQSFPTQRKAFLAVIGAQDSVEYNMISFDIDNHKPCLPHYVSIQIQVNHTGSAIWRTVVDEGASTCVMSIDCLRGLGSPTFIPSLTMLKAFDGHTFQPHGIIPTFSVKLGGKTVEVEVEVVDAPLDYNLLLGRNWTYVMEAVVSSVYRAIKFPH